MVGQAFQQEIQRFSNMPLMQAFGRRIDGNQAEMFLKILFLEEFLHRSNFGMDHLFFVAKERDFSKKKEFFSLLEALLKEFPGIMEPFSSQTPLPVGNQDLKNTSSTLPEQDLTDRLHLSINDPLFSWGSL